MAQALSLYGAGRLGQTLAKLWQQHARFEIEQLLTRSCDSAQQACDFIGIDQSRGQADIKQLKAAKVWLLACPDSELENAVENLAQESLVQAGTIVFHCSGAISSEVLAPLKQLGAVCASIHPVHSFAEPALSLQQFSGSHCACEGDSQALDQLIPAFQVIGGQTFSIEPQHKLLYHAGSVMACNYMVGLLQASLDTYQLAGIESEQALKMLAPLLQGTLDNVLKQGPAQALTGPIARGDAKLVAQQLSQLKQASPQLGQVYQVLGQQCLALSQQTGLSSQAQQQLTKALDL